MLCGSHHCADQDWPVRNVLETGLWAVAAAADTVGDKKYCFRARKEIAMDDRGQEKRLLGPLEPEPVCSRGSAGHNPSMLSLGHLNTGGREVSTGLKYC